MLKRVLLSTIFLTFASVGAYAQTGVAQMQGVVTEGANTYTSVISPGGPPGFFVALE